MKVFNFKFTSREFKNAYAGLATEFLFAIVLILFLCDMTYLLLRVSA